MVYDMRYDTYDIKDWTITNTYHLICHLIVLLLRKHFFFHQKKCKRSYYFQFQAFDTRYSLQMHHSLVLSSERRHMKMMK